MEHVKPLSAMGRQPFCTLLSATFCMFLYNHLLSWRPPPYWRGGSHMCTWHHLQLIQSGLAFSPNSWSVNYASLWCLVSLIFLFSSIFVMFYCSIFWTPTPLGWSQSIGGVELAAQGGQGCRGCGCVASIAWYAFDRETNISFWTVF